MNGDELITYGFKRIIEELEKIEKLLEKIEHNTLVASGETIRSNGIAEKIENAAVITQMGVLETKQLVKGIAKHGGLEEQGL